MLYQIQHAALCCICQSHICICQTSLWIAPHPAVTLTNSTSTRYSNYVLTSPPPHPNTPAVPRAASISSPRRYSVCSTNMQLSNPAIFPSPSHFHLSKPNIFLRSLFFNIFSLVSSLYTFNIALKWGTALQARRSRVRFPIVSLGFLIDTVFPAALWLTQPLTEMSTRNISCGVKAAGAYGWQIYHLHGPVVLISGSLNLLQSSGPVQACNGIALPLPLLLTLPLPLLRSLLPYNC